MVLYGYARVSTFDQDVTVQEQGLRVAGCDVIRAETASGTRRIGPTELQTLPYRDKFPVSRILSTSP
jgi:DNA invertase Pin-like site-specific DNA recombinase